MGGYWIPDDSHKYIFCNASYILLHIGILSPAISRLDIFEFMHLEVKVKIYTLIIFVVKTTLGFL
jgi:hypothetical protein